MELSLTQLEAELADALRDHPEVRCERINLGGATWLRLTVEPEQGVARTVRIAVSSVSDEEPVFLLRWSAYRGEPYTENSDGTTYGGLELTLHAITHWIVDGLPWRSVPEFNRSSAD